MPAIWNVNQNYNANNNKKLTSKLTFSAGETFRGKITEKLGDSEVKVRLSDGWQFSAEVEGDASFTEQDMVKFEVIGYEAGKLKLKLLNGNEEGIATTKDSLQTLANKEGLEDTDVDILKKMVEYNIPLNRDNIKFIKSIIQFSQRVNNDPKEIDNFINKYLESKNIDPSSEQAAQMKGVLSEFINVFKNMSSEDILFFLENKIEMNTENIQSYNKLFGGNINLEEHFKGLANELKDISSESGIQVSANKITDETVANESLAKGVNVQNPNNEGLFATKVYDSVESANVKLDVMDILKSMVSDEISGVKDQLISIVQNKMSELNTTEYSNISQNINLLGNDKLVDLIKGSLNENGALDKDGLKNIINNIFGKEVQLSDKEADGLMEVLKPIINNNLSEISKDNEFKNDILSILENRSESSSSEQMNNISSEKILSLIKDASKGRELIKADINNVFSNLLNKNVKITDEEFDSLKDILSKGDEVFLPNKFVGKDGLKNELMDKSLSIRDSVKDIIKVIEENGLDNSKIAQFLKENINDFKLFNEVNKEYYYLDVPVNQGGKEYQCKLVIKDNRKDGKQIDKTNVKVVVSVNTINLGKIDNYLTIRGTNLNVDIKCNEEMVKILDKNKDQLVKSLHNIGLIANVSVSKKVEEVSLTSCREFFNESKLSIIDRIV